MFIPNTYRVIIKPIQTREITSSGVILGGQLKSGENLLYGEVVHPGDTKFEKGQKVFYSEYSAASLVDARSLHDGSRTYTDVKDDNYVVVSQDDIMAYYDSDSISEIVK